MIYPGNPALSADAQQRLLGTFDQTLDLAESGSRQEALLGCDFVLRMDPQFEPARRLQERLKSSAGPVPVADLKLPAAGAALDEIHDLSHLAAELPELDDLDAELPELPAAVPAHELRARFAALLAARRFDELLADVERESAAVLADPELGQMAEAAHQRMEAEPYVRKFLDKVRQAIGKGDGAEADRLLEKARALDPTHPGIAELAAPRAAPAAAAGPTPLVPPLPFPAPAPPASPAAAGAGSAPALELPAALRPIAAPSAFGGDSESERRIRQLLDEGQAALDGGDPQAAIDAWSRIFLIDIDHQEAAQRIEGARKVKAESERQVEEIFHDGLGRLEAGDLAAARQAFERVLELQPSYLAAREYLQQLDAGEVPVVPPGTAPVLAPASPRDPTLGTGEGPTLPLPHLNAAPGELKEEILVPPEPGEGAAPGARRGRREAREAQAADTEAPAAGRKRASRTFVYVGSAVLALVVAVGGFVYLKRDQLFPNSSDEAAALVPKTNPITRATALHKQGKNAIAVAQLRHLPPKDPHYAEAQKLIAAWDAPAAPAAPAVAPLAPEAAERRAHLLADARQASATRAYLRAVEQFEEAGKIAKLEGTDADDMARARHEVEPFATQVEAFRQHEWEYVLPTLWRLREANPGNRDIDRLIVDSYYDLGVRDLQRADPTQAANRFQEALKLSPDDADLKRHYLFAQTYQERPQDLLFRIYVKYLPLR
jgi:tetratricopeptide (TPR) repeat protein